MQVYLILDEFILAGELQETSKKVRISMNFLVLFIHLVLSAMLVFLECWCVVQPIYVSGLHETKSVCLSLSHTSMVICSVTTSSQLFFSFVPSCFSGLVLTGTMRNQKFTLVAGWLLLLHFHQRLQSSAFGISTPQTCNKSV